MRNPITLHEEVYGRIKEMIVRQQLLPGSRLILRNLAKQLGTSSMPVLEAIRRLERDGLVTQIPKWGASVKEWTEDDRLEAFHIRRALEGEAARLFVMRATPLQRETLVELCQKLEDFAPTDPMAALETDIQFHVHIARSTGYGRLAQLIEISKIPLAIFWRCVHFPIIVGKHRSLAKALLGNDPDVAMLAMWKHVEDRHELTHRAGPQVSEGLVIDRINLQTLNSQRTVVSSDTATRTGTH